jgi:hypothetical protein
MFITPEPSGFKVDFEMELGTVFHPNGFRIEAMQGDIWRTRPAGCLTGLSCTFTGQDAQVLIESMGDGDAFRFTFRDRHGQAQDLSWPLQTFEPAWGDFHTRAKSRELIQD